MRSPATGGFAPGGTAEPVRGCDSGVVILVGCHAAEDSPAPGSGLRAPDHNQTLRLEGVAGCASCPTLWLRPDQAVADSLKC